MKNQIKSMLNDIVGDELSEKIFEANFGEKKPIKGYKKGNILTFKQLRELPNNSIIHLVYLDDDGDIRTNDFKVLNKHSEEEFSTSDGFTFPLYKNDDENKLIENANNSDWTFTIREAIKK